MNELLKDRSFKRDVMLILVGALLASIPTLVSTYMQGESQLHQIILDRKISALKDYSVANNKLVSDLLPKVEQMESRIIYYHDDFFANHKDDKQMLIKIYNEFQEFLNLHQVWIADINTQTLIINALFETNIPSKSIYYFEPLKENVDKKGSDQLLREIKKNIISLKKIIVEDVNDRQEVMRKLSVLIN